MAKYLKYGKQLAIYNKYKFNGVNELYNNGKVVVNANDLIIVIDQHINGNFHSNNIDSDMSKKRICK